MKSNSKKTIFENTKYLLEAREYLLDFLRVRAQCFIHVAEIHIGYLQFLKFQFQVNNKNTTICFVIYNLLRNHFEPFFQLRILLDSHQRHLASEYIAQLSQPIYDKS